jgi:4-hydroxy-tetrahydrodipicolinate synthase
MSRPTFSGVLVPVVTPFAADLAPDTGRFIAHCKRLLAAGADGLAIFGTTSEANSLSLKERLTLLDALVDAGVPAAKLMPGAGATALPDAVDLMRAAGRHGCGGVLLLPPFYYKVATDDGLFDFTAAAIERAASPDLSVYLYHIPPVAQVGWSHALIRRLIDAFPRTIVGLKDSSGDWSHTQSLITSFPGFAVFPGSESFLLQGLRLGGAGCISATANINVEGIRRVIDAHAAGGGEPEQARATAARKIIEGFPVIPALKALIAADTGESDWARVRPPFRALGADRAEQLIVALSSAGFALNGPGVLKDTAL